MENLAKKLDKFSLEKFINAQRLALCQKTLNQQQMASFLNFTADQIAIIMAPPDNFSRCFKLYEYIEKTTDASRFLEALVTTSNEHIIKFIGSVLLDSPSEWGLWFNIPHQIESFCGRLKFLSQLHDQLKPRDDSEAEVTVLSQVKIVSGPAGIGKTQTVRKYISQYFKFYKNFIWIDAESENSIATCFLKLAREIKIPVKNSEGESREIQDIVKEIYRKICLDAKSNSNLIVFDNAGDFESCQNFLPILPHPKMKKPMILVTSRNQEWISSSGKIQVFPLNVLSDDESLEFFLKELEIPESDIQEFREESKEFIELIGGLPLALQQAVDFIKHKEGNYVQEFKSSSNVFKSFSPVPVSSSGSSSTAFVILKVTFDNIKKLEKGESAVKILEILCFLHADKIPSSFLHNLVPELEDEEFSGALKLLEKFSFIKIEETGDNFGVSIHRPLQFVILQYLKECGGTSKVGRNLAEKGREVLENIKLSESCEDIFLNLHQVIKNQELNFIPVSIIFVNFMTVFGKVLSSASRYSESLELYQKLYSKKLELLSKDHNNTLSTQNDIAMQLSELKRYDEALALYKEILEKQVQLDENHPHVLTTKHNIACVLREQGKYDESLEMFQQVSAQQNKIQGEDHPFTLKTQSQIAAIYAALGNFSKAVDLFEEVENKQIQRLGPDHRDVLSTKHNRATVLFQMDKLEEASTILNEVYEKEKEILGESHLHTIETLTFLADALVKQKKYREALPMYKKIYEVRKTTLGENHPETTGNKTIILYIENNL